MKDYSQIRGETLSSVLSSTLTQLQKSEESLDKLRSLSERAKTPSQRTAVNIIVDDQKKAIKALQRLASDLSDHVHHAA